MPKELIWGDVITVRRGDLSVLAARTRADLAALTNEALDRLVDRVTATPHSDLEASLRDLHERHAALLLDRNVLRRRHQLLSEFVDDLARYDADDPDGFQSYWIGELPRLREQLDRLPLDGANGTEPETPLWERYRVIAEFVARLNAARRGLTPASADRLLEIYDREHARFADAVSRLREPPPAALPFDPDDVLDEPLTDATDEPRLCDGCGRANAGAVHPTDDGRALVCADCRSRLDEESEDTAADTAEDTTDEVARARWAEIARRPRRFRRAGEDDPNLPADDPSAEVSLQLALALTWVRDGGAVNVGIIGHDHETGTEHDVGGFYLTLDWAAANKLIKKTRVARDQSHGSPE